MVLELHEGRTGAFREVMNCSIILVAGDPYFFSQRLLAV